MNTPKTHLIRSVLGFTNAKPTDVVTRATAVLAGTLLMLAKGGPRGLPLARR